MRTSLDIPGSPWGAGKTRSLGHHPFFSLNFHVHLKQEKLLSLPGDRLFWSEADVIQATEDFDQSHRISEGTFADIYQGQRHGVAFAFKKLREVS